ncbi:DUF551 domain-containing protein [Cronobacter turicensis]
MSTISTEQAKVLRMAYAVWQQDYDPVEDKAQYEMFGLGIVAIDEPLALRKEREKAEPVPDLHKVIYHFRDWNEGFPVERFKADYVISWMLANYPPAPPAPVHVDEIAAQAGINPAIADAYMQGCHDTESRQAETDATAQQFESLAGKAVGGWIPCSEQMPPEKAGVLVATEFDGPGDWRMKWGTRVPGHPDAKNEWFIPGASWTPSHWQPLPEPPCK